MTSSLAHKSCVPCKGIGKTLEPQEIHEYLSQVPAWEVGDDENTIITRKWKFKDFATSMNFVNAVAKIADEQDHHPDIRINYNRVTLELTTHVLGGLTENDFVMAAKIDEID